MAKLKRSGKFYRNNEKEVMESLGLKPTINSGSTWIEKEDGQSDEIICQLKSTDAQSIRIVKKDIDTLIYNSLVVHKLPLFVIQFLSTNEIFLIMRPEDLSDISNSLNKAPIDIESIESLSNREHPLNDDNRPLKKESNNIEDLIDINSDEEIPKRKVIKSGGSARKLLEKERNKKYSKKVRKAT